MSYKLLKILARVAKSRGFGPSELVKLGVGVFAFAWLWHNTSAFVALICLVVFLACRSRREVDDTDPQLQRIFEATAGLLGLRTEEIDRQTKKGRPVPAERWVRFADGGGVDLDFPATFEASTRNVSRLREQVERVVGSEFIATVEPTTVKLRARPVLPARVEFEPVHDAKALTFARSSTRQVAWMTDRAPHGLVSGATGSGKTVAMRALILSALVNGWRVVGADPKRIELSWLRGRERCEYASSLEDMANAVANVRLEMMRRFDLIDAGQPLDAPPLLLVVDEATSLLAQAGDAKLPVVSDLSEIARLGRVAEVHLLLGMQRPDSGKDGLPGELKRNLDFRLAVGTHDRIASEMVLGSDAGMAVDSTPGRAMMRILGSHVLVQVAFTPNPREDLTTVEKYLPPLLADRDVVVPVPMPCEPTALEPTAVKLNKNVEAVPSTTRKVRKSA